jgi:tetratricopeptide (TPR) repeat protein
MRYRWNEPIRFAMAVWLLLISTSSAAQTPHHKHYVDNSSTTASAASGAAAGTAQAGPQGQLAPRLQNLGSHTFPVKTKSRQAQLFINQGLNLAYGFNHAEAGRAFAEAARLDPECAMAYWGQALVLGPNINAAMDPNDEPRAYALAQKAIALRSRAAAREQAYIDALARRYSGRPEDRAARDKAYADAMAAVVKKYPADLDAATLYAEAVMDLRPWGYWMPDGRPYEGTREIVSLIESVIARKPSHPGALHLYIHLMEPTTEPEKAEAAADRLLTLMPGAGHIVHMPSHIYQRVGRYADAARSNEMAMLADEDYIRQCRAQGLYPMGYYPHNIHFLWFAASMEGRGQVALDAARKVNAQAPDEALKDLPLLAGFKVVPYYTLTRFGRWEQMLSEPEPPDSPFMRAVWHYARGLAFVATGQLDRADQELAEVKQRAADKALEYALFSPNLASKIFAIAPEVLGGELAAARQDYETAIAHLERAVRLEDGLVYTEPSEWHYPPRQALGAVLLRAGRPSEAETVYWEDLKRNRDNGWSLFGLAQALRAQGKTDQAAVVLQRFEKAWSRADVKLTASRIM